MKIVVTGAAGFIGSHLCEALAGDGHSVVGIDSFTDYYSPNLKRINAQAVEKTGVKVIEADLAKDDIESVFTDADFIYHLAAQPGISSDVSLDTYVKNNIVATHRVLEAAKQSKNLKGFFNIATSSVYGSVATGDERTIPKPTSYYGVTKLAAENLAFMYYHQYGLPVCSFRIFSVYGERERPDKLFPKLIDSITKDKELPLFEGSEDHKRSYTYVGDIVEGLARVLDRTNTCVGEVINLGNEESITTGEAIKIVEKIIGKKVKVEKKPPRAGDQKETRAVVKKAEKVLSYKPTTPLEEGLRREVEWYREKILKL